MKKPNSNLRSRDPRLGADAGRNCFHARASLLAAADEGVRRCARGGRAPLPNLEFGLSAARGADESD